MTRAREPRLPAEEPRRAARRRSAARVAEIARLLDLARVLGRKARNLTADLKQKISLGRGLVRAGRRRDPVRRAADRHRSAPQMAAALDAEGAPPPASTSP